MTFEQRSPQALRVMFALTQNVPAPGDEVPLETLMGAPARPSGDVAAMGLLRTTR